MSVTKDIYNYLGIKVEDSLDDLLSSDEYTSTDYDYGKSSGYQSDISYVSGTNVEQNVLSKRPSRRRSTGPLDVVDKLEIMAMINYISDIVDLVCRLGPYIRPTTENKTGFNNKVNELVDALYDAPNQRVLKKNRACSSILISLTMLKDELTKT